MKTKLAKVPKEWHLNMQRVAKELGISTPEAIKQYDEVYIRLLKKQRRINKNGIC